MSRKPKLIQKRTNKITFLITKKMKAIFQPCQTTNEYIKSIHVNFTKNKTYTVYGFFIHMEDLNRKITYMLVADDGFLSWMEEDDIKIIDNKVSKYWSNLSIQNVPNKKNGEKTAVLIECFHKDMVFCHSDLFDLPDDLDNGSIGTEKSLLKLKKIQEQMESEFK